MPKNKRQRRRRTALYVPVCILLIIFAVLFGMNIFFKVEEIDVIGNSKYSAEEIIAASGISMGDYLFLVDRNEAGISICNALPYVDEVRIKKHLPDSVSIELIESVPVASIYVGGTWLIDKNCRVLEKTVGTEDRGLMNILGITPEAPVLGKKLEVPEGEALLLSYASDMLNGFFTLNIHSAVSELDFSNVINITFIYDGRFTVAFGSMKNVMYKLELMMGAIEQSGPNDRGKIDVSEEKVSIIYAN